MASFSRSALNALGTGYDLASPKTDSSSKTAYQRYIEKYYGPGVTSHTDPIALARAATGAVAEGLKSGAGFLSHAAAGLLGAPMGDSNRGRSATPAGYAPQEKVYGGRGGGGAVGRMPSGNISSQFLSGGGAGLSSPGPADANAERFFQAISEAEGTTKYGYNTVYGGANGIGGRPLTSMTLRELTDYQKGMIPRQGASPMGKFQINRGTVLHHATKLGLDLDKTVFDETTQKKLALSIAGEQGIKPPVWDGFRGKPKLLSTALQAYSQIKGKPIVASAYTSTDTATTPAQQAAAAEAAGQPAGQSGSISRRGSDVAAMQRDLNSRGAKLTVDGLEGPLTRQAAQQFLGSPTSVRTPSFTSTPTTSPQATSANNWSSLQGSPVSTVNQRQDYVPTPGFVNRQSYTSGRGDEGTLPRTGVAPTPAINQPYTNYGWADNSLNRQNELRDEAASQRYRDFENQRAAARTIPAGAQYAYANSTGGSINPNVRSVPVVAIRSDVAHQSPLPGYYNDQTASGMTITGGRRVPVSTGYSPTTAPVLTGGFSRPAVPQTPYLNQPYTTTTGGANAIVAPTQTARIPQARPDYQPPQQAVPTLLERLDNLVERAERALGGNRGSDSRSSGGRSGGGGAGSPNSGLGYSGGRGYGGGSIGRGTGGAINPNR